MELQGTFPLFSPEKLSLGGQTQSLWSEPKSVPAYCWDHSPTGIYVWLSSLHPRAGVTLEWQWPLWLLLWWALAMEVLMETGLQENTGMGCSVSKVSAGLL